MIPHRLRLYLILAALAACLAALAALALGVDVSPVAAVLPGLLAALGLPAGSLATGGPPELAAALVALVALLVPAAIDAARVEWRRRDPGVLAVGDDEIEPAELERRRIRMRGRIRRVMRPPYRSAEADEPPEREDGEA